MIASDVVDQVRERTDLLKLVGEVVALKRHGRAFVGCCPFHKEKTGSFHVNPDRGFFHCFGCKESGSAIDFMMKHHGLTFVEAVVELAERLGLEVGRVDAQERGDADRRKRQREELYGATRMAAAWFERQLAEHPGRDEALRELARRGLEPGTNDDVKKALAAHRVGFAPAEWDGLASFFRDQGVSPAVGEAVGLLLPRRGESGYYDRFRHRLMFGIVDVQGRVVAFSGRALADIDDKGEPIPKYVNSSESVIYQKGHTLFGLHQAKHAIRTAGSAMLVEGNFDVVSLAARGVENVVAPLGTAFTEEQAALLKRFTSHVTLLFDGDAPGRKATRAARDVCRSAGLRARVAKMPDGLDPDEMVRQHGTTGLNAIVAGARGMLESMIEEARADARAAAADVAERAARVDEVTKLLAGERAPAPLRKLTDALVRRADKTPGFDELERVLREVVASPAAIEAAKRRAAPKVDRTEPQKRILAALVEFPELLLTEDLSALEGAFALAAHRLSTAPTEIASRFLASVPSELHGAVLEALASPGESVDKARRIIASAKRELASQDEVDSTRG